MRYLENIRQLWNEMEARHRLWCGYCVIAVLALSLCWSALAAKTAALERKRSARESVLKELLPLKFSYLTAKREADQAAGRMATLRPDDSPAKIIDEIGIKGKGVKLSSVKGDERPGFIEDAADIRIDGLTANELVNLLYRLEKGSRPLTIKKTVVRGRFDDPSRLDLAMTAALVKPAPGQGQARP